MPKAKDNEDPEAHKKKKTGKAKGGPKRGGGGGGGGGPIGGGQFVASDSSNNREASSSLLHEEVILSNVSAANDSFLYSADETYNAPKKKNKKTKAKIQKSNDDEEEEDNRERLNISEVSRSFDGFNDSEWTEEEEEEANGHRGSLRRMGERLDISGGTRADAGASSAFAGGHSISIDDGADRGKAAEDRGSKTQRGAKISLDKFGKFFRKFKKENPTPNDEGGETVTMTAVSTSMNSGPGMEETTRHTHTTRGTHSHTSMAPQPPAYAVGGGGEGGEEGQWMGEKERVLRERQRKVSDRKICESVLVTVVLVLGFVLGIVLTSLSSLGLTFQIVGPTILGLSSFGLVGKVFVTVFWEEDPFLWTKGKFRRIAERHRRNQKTTEAQGTAAAATAVEMRPYSSGQRPPQIQGTSSSFRNSDEHSEF